MGFFDDLWSGIKNTASSIYSGVKNVAGKVYDTVSRPISWVSKGLDYASKIPILGTLLAPAITAGKTIVGGAESVLNTGKQIGDVVKAIGLKMGGVVNKRMFQKAE